MCRRWSVRVTDDERVWRQLNELAVYGALEINSQVRFDRPQTASRRDLCSVAIFESAGFDTFDFVVTTATGEKDS